MDVRRCVTVFEEYGQVMLQLPDRQEAIPVEVLWPRPITGRGEEVSFLDEKQHEVLMIDGVHVLDREPRHVVEEALTTTLFLTRKDSSYGKSMTLGATPSYQHKCMNSHYRNSSGSAQTPPFRCKSYHAQRRIAFQRRQGF